MIFAETPLAGAWLITAEPARDERGYFARTFDREAFRAHGLEVDVSTGAVSYNDVRGTLRGLHYQAAPALETKLVRCGAGALWDVIVDLRPASPTFGRWHAVELNAANHLMVYIPPGFAHGFQTLEHGTEVVYQLAGTYSPADARGHRFDDPALAIPWPLPIARIADADLKWPPLAGPPPRGKMAP